MPNLDEWKSRVKQQSITDEEAIKQYMQSKAISSEPFRLEALQDTDEKLVLIQGNLKGLASLKSILDRLIKTNAVGGHAHLEDGHGLTKANV